MRANALCIGMAVLFLTANAAPAADITAYRVTLQPDFSNESISAIEHLTLAPRGERALRLAVRDLQIDAVDAGGIALPWRVESGQLEVSVREAPSNGRELRIVYHGTPKQGLIFGPGYVSSTWEGCDWMLCDDAPGHKAPIAIDLLLPPGYVSLASGVPGGEQQIAPNLVRHSWREARPYSAYLYGFAAGKFHHVRQSAGGIALHYYGAADDETLARKFAPTAGMLAFLQEKAGVPMPHGAYRQLLIPGSEAQELSTFSVIGAEELDPILADPQEDWVVVHEMAHQWWGNLLTCKTWADFWLNEGITNFMVAAYKEHQWGRAAYEGELAVQRRRYQAAIDAGFDKPLAYAGNYPSLKVRRAIQYGKGALFMAALRTELGDKVFWSGLRRYTQEHAGGGVASRDLQTAMERAAGRKLDTLFDKWVY